jgi:hypothetical protein
MPGQSIAAILGDPSVLSEWNRFNAIASIARRGQISTHLSGPDGTAILQGATQQARAAAVGELARMFKPDLNGQEAEAILGSDADLSEDSRYNAIAALARAKRFGPSLADDAALALKGTTQQSRAASIGEIAPYLRSDMPGQSIAAILGDPSVLSEWNRSNAIAALARAGILRGSLGTKEMTPILEGTTEQARAAALTEIAAAAKTQGGTQQTSSPVTNQTSSLRTDQCSAPRVVIDKPSPTCRERWQTAIFRAGVPKIFFAADEYIDAWQKASETGERLGDIFAQVADLALFGKTVMKIEDGATKAALILTKGNSMLLMLGFELPEQTLGESLASEAAETIRSGIEAMVEQALVGVVSPMSVAPQTMTLANKLIAYANTVRYSRLRNTYTVALEYMRLLYRMGGDQSAFARSLGLADNASVHDCLGAVNKKSFGFPTNLTDAGAYNPTLAEKVVNHWVMAVSEYAALKVE